MAVYIKRCGGWGMSVFIIQDKYEPEDRYIASRPTLEEARMLAEEFEEFDREAGEYEPDRYRIKDRGYCYNDYSEKCGFCKTGICLLEHPDADCPLVRKKAAAHSSAQGEAI